MPQGDHVRTEVQPQTSSMQVVSGVIEAAGKLLEARHNHLRMAEIAGDVSPAVGMLQLPCSPACSEPAGSVTLDLGPVGGVNMSHPMRLPMSGVTVKSVAQEITPAESDDDKGESMQTARLHPHEG